MAKRNPIRAQISQRGRSGMTLIEILIATAILALGMVGILTLFLLAIRNVSVAVGRTAAASVARQVIVSLDHCSLDLGALDDPYSGASAVASIGTQDLDGTTDIPSAIYEYSVDTDIGHGVSHPCFRVPDNCVLPLPPYLAGEDWNTDGNPDYMAVRWAYDPVADERRPSPYGWTAIFMPDAVPVTASTTYYVQIAIWRDYGLIDIGSPTGDFTSGSNVVDIGGAPSGSPFWDRVTPGAYIRHTNIGIWYQISDVNESALQVTLSHNFWHPVPGALSGSVEVASRFKLVGLYDTLLTPGGQ